MITPKITIHETNNFVPYVKVDGFNTLMRQSVFAEMEFDETKTVEHFFDKYRNYILIEDRGEQVGYDNDGGVLLFRKGTVVKTDDKPIAMHEFKTAVYFSTDYVVEQFGLEKLPQKKFFFVEPRYVFDYLGGIKSLVTPKSSIIDKLDKTETIKTHASTNDDALDNSGSILTKTATKMEGSGLPSVIVEPKRTTVAQIIPDADYEFDDEDELDVIQSVMGPNCADTHRSTEIYSGQNGEDPDYELEDGDEIVESSPISQSETTVSPNAEMQSFIKMQTKVADLYMMCPGILRGHLQQAYVECSLYDKLKTKHELSHEDCLKYIYGHNRVMWIVRNRFGKFYKDIQKVVSHVGKKLDLSKKILFSLYQSNKALNKHKRNI